MSGLPPAGTSGASGEAAGGELALLGYYGFGNAGDEALLAGVLQGVRLLAPDVRPLVLTADPAGTSALHGVSTADRWRPGAVWRSFSSARALFLGGGSLLQDVTSRRSVYYYLGVLALAQARGVRTCLFGQGIGPLRAPATRRLARRVLARCTGIWVRDAGSYEETLRLGVRPAGGDRPGPLLRVTGDPVFLLLPPAPAETARPAGELPIWVVAARPWPEGERWQPHLLAALLPAAQAAGVNVVFLAMQPAADHALAVDLARQAAAAGVPAQAVAPRDFREVQQQLARADLVVAMRLHALIMAVQGGVGSVAISYDPKVAALAELFALPVVTVPELEAADGAGRLSAALAAGRQEAGAAKARLLRQAAQQRELVLADLQAALAAAGWPAVGSPG